MNIYLRSFGGLWIGMAPAVLVSAAAEGSPSRDDALAKVRARIVEEYAALERLGASFDLETSEESVIEWDNAWGTPLEPFLPIAPGLRDAGLARIEELAGALQASLADLSPADWDRRDGADGWNVRLVVDHIGIGFPLFMRRLEPWPLDADTAQAAALEDLIARVETASRDQSTFEVFGMNAENRRVRWTARKLVRVVRALQLAWLGHVAGGPSPEFGAGHEDIAGDDGAVDEHDISVLRQQDADLRRIARDEPRLRQIASSYRYYRDRLQSWPADELARWRAMQAAFRGQVAAYDERDLARIRMAPDGSCATVRQQLGVAIAHFHEHGAQIAKIRGETSVAAAG